MPRPPLAVSILGFCCRPCIPPRYAANQLSSQPRLRHAAHASWLPLDSASSPSFEASVFLSPSSTAACNPLPILSTAAEVPEKSAVTSASHAHRCRLQAPNGRFGGLKFRFSCSPHPSNRIRPTRWHEWVPGFTVDKAIRRNSCNHYEVPPHLVSLQFYPRCLGASGSRNTLGNSGRGRG